jgi:hypothetical protein|tara:strand:+ start:841 stop:1113 length:273 start_codon:yes stop_codon:yes gene_type:complete
MNEETQQQKPYITIDDVQIYIEDLPEDGQAIFGRIQRLNQKKVNLVLDLEEVNAGLASFTNSIVGIVNADDDSSNEPSIEETDAFPTEND